MSGACPACRYFTSVLKAAAAKHCGGKLLAFHEGGYSAYYVPFCGLAVIEEMAGVTTKVVDPELEEHCKVRVNVYRLTQGLVGMFWQPGMPCLPKRVVGACTCAGIGVVESCADS